MSMLNQAHVEAICSATYLENYLDCLDALPEDLQRILTQIREVDVRLSELESGTAPFEEVFINLKDGETPDTKFVTQLERMLLKMQEFEDEKIQLSNSLMEFIENRSKQLDSDRENLDPANHMPHDTPSTRSNNSNSKRNGTNETKPSSTVQSSASAQSVDSNKDSNKQTDQHRAAANSAKKRKLKPEPAAPVNKSTVNTKSHSTTTSNHSTSNSTTNHSTKQDTPAKKAASSVSHEEVKTAAKLSSKRKRRSRAGTHPKPKDISMEPTPEPEEPTYCICDQVSYGEMIGCDNDVCPIEWFHFNCVNLNNKPKGKWYCPKCRGDKQTIMRRGADKGR